jgi:hypothetical protein
MHPLVEMDRTHNRVTFVPDLDGGGVYFLFLCSGIIAIAGRPGVWQLLAGC